MWNRPVNREIKSARNIEVRTGHYYIQGNENHIEIKIKRIISVLLSCFQLE